MRGILFIFAVAVQPVGARQKATFTVAEKGVRERFGIIETVLDFRVAEIGWLESLEPRFVIEPGASHAGAGDCLRSTDGVETEPCHMEAHAS
jgi:hypothetical protein